MQVGELVSLLIVNLGISIYVYINAAVGYNDHVSVITELIVERRLNMSDIVVIKQRCYLVNYKLLRAFK